MERLLPIVVRAGQTASHMSASFDRGDVEYKAATDLVTEVDRAVQAQIITDLAREASSRDYTIIAEEADQNAPLSTVPTFVIDPVDGTTNFVHRLPHWCVSVGLWEDAIPRAGVVYAPALGELFYAEAGTGAWLQPLPLPPENEITAEVQTPASPSAQRLAISPNSNPRAALGCTGIFGGSDAMRAASADLMKRALAELRDVRRHGAAALDLCWVAAGRYDLFWEGHLSAWDIAAGALIAREAGAVVTPLDGHAVTDRELFTARSVVAGTPPLHAWFRNRFGEDEIGATRPR